MSQGIDMWIPPCGSGFPNLPDQEEELTSTKKPPKNCKTQKPQKNHKIQKPQKITKHKTHKKNNVKKTTLVSTCSQPMQMV